MLYYNFKYYNFPTGDILTHISEPLNEYSSAYDYVSVGDNPSL